MEKRTIALRPSSKLIEAFKCATSERVAFISGTVSRPGIATDPNASKILCFCEKCNGKSHVVKDKMLYSRYSRVEFDSECAGFGHNIKNDAVVFNDKMVEEYLKCMHKKRDDFMASKKTRSVGAIIAKHPEDESGIVIYGIKRYIEYTGTSQNIEYKTTHYFEIIPGKVAKCWKLLKTGDTETSTDSIMDFVGTNVWWEGAPHNSSYYYDNRNALNFFCDAFPQFCERTGLTYLSDIMDISADTFFSYLCVYAEYPVLELLIKMKYWTLVEGIVRSMCAASKAFREEQIQELSQILAVNETRGSKAMTIPPYIAKYIRDNMMEYRDFVAWANLYQVAKLSKEQFESLISCDEFIILQLAYRNRNGNTIYGKNYLIENLTELVKYGYFPEKLVRYVVKLKREQKISFHEVFTLIRDTAQMADLLQVPFELYPKDLRARHDSLSVAFKSFQQKEKDSAVNAHGHEIEAVYDFAKSEKVFADSQYKIVVPKTVRDIVDEGQQQSNCVGSYVDSFAKKETIIFFVRDKDTPQKSFVTVEFRNGEMRQCYYAYNRRVPEGTKEFQVAKAFCKKLAKFQVAEAFGKKLVKVA